jgi:hypothetical protein
MNNAPPRTAAILAMRNDWPEMHAIERARSPEGIGWRKPQQQRSVVFYGNDCLASAGNGPIKQSKSLILKAYSQITNDCNKPSTRPLLHDSNPLSSFPLDSRIWFNRDVYPI